MVVDSIGARSGIAVKKKAFDAIIGKGRLGESEVVLAKPQLYMNRSGYSVGPLFDFYTCDAEDLVVVHDDIDLSFGQLKVARGAGHGGHNGVRSIIEELGFNDFYRVRIGVGRPPEYLDASDHVLQKFSDEEREELENLVERAAIAVEDVLSLSLREVQQKHHG